MRSFARQIPERSEIANWEAVEAFSDSVLRAEAETAFAEKQKAVRILRDRINSAYADILGNADVNGVSDSDLRVHAFLNVLRDYHWYKEHGLEFIHIHD